MDKDKELEAFHLVFGKEHTYQVVPHEQPDFLVMAGDRAELGVEITEIYSHETDAKLKNLDGYSLGLIDGTMQIHRRDMEHIKVEEATIQDNDGKEKAKVMGIFQEMPSFKDRVAILENAILDKENKIPKYLNSCPVADLIIVDSSSLFRHDRFEEFYRPFYALHKKHNLMGSLFREIYLVTTQKDNAEVFIPLRGNMFLSDCFAYEMFLREEGITKRSSKLTIETLLAALYSSGYTDLVISSGPDDFGIHFGPWEMHFSKSGKSIRDRTLLFENVEFERLDELVKSFPEVALSKAGELIEMRKTVFSAMEFSLPVKWHNNAPQSTQ